MKSSFANATPRHRYNPVFGPLLLLLLASSCKEAGPVTSSGTDEEKTLKSLTKANDHPFYTMKFYGDYGFAERVGLPKGELVASAVSKKSNRGFHRGGVESAENRRAKRSTNSALLGILRVSALETINTKIAVRRSTPGDSTWGCTCFIAYGNPANPQFGRNFDWHDCIPLLLFTNPPNGYASISIVDLEYLGYTRANLPDGGGDKTALLETPGYPFDGMNEKGVTVGMMAVPAARAPYDPKKISLGELGTIRLILDFAASTDEAIALLGNYNLRIEDPPIHYLIADPGGHSAVIEYINGTMSVLKNGEPWHVSTNFIITGSGAPAVSPCWRYNTAYSELRTANGVMSSEGALGLLSRVSQASTIWSVVYGMSGGTVLVATQRGYAGALKFTLGESLPPKH
jgi:hypothetical protein